jgi:hypothetical protein
VWNRVTPRLETQQNSVKKKAPKMKKFGFATLAASALVGAVVGLAAPAQAAVPPTIDSAITVPAGIDHRDWLNDIYPNVSVPHVDTTVQQSR